jgi:hypothetical protein
MYLYLLLVLTFCVLLTAALKPWKLSSLHYGYLKTTGMVCVALLISVNLLDIIQKLNQPWRISTPYKYSEYEKLNILLKIILFFILVLFELCIYKIL